VTVKVLRIPEHGGPSLAAGDVDLAVGFFPDLKAGFYQQSLYLDEFVCVLRADHPRARAALTAKQFAEMRHAIVSTVGTGHEPAIARAMAKHRIKPALTIPNFMAVPVIVSQTDHVVIVPGRLGRVFAGYPGLKVVPSPIRIPSFEIKQHWHERYHLDPANRWLRALVAELFLAS
jgi:DNA-binding transcriptional LysR family regulator